MIKGRGLKVGVVGLGSMGKNHARIAAQLPGLNLIGVADPNPETHDFAKTLKTPAFLNYHALLPLCEAIIIATPTSTHFQIAEEGLTAGKHILIEKPATGSSVKVQLLAEAAKRKDLIFTAGFIERFNPAFLRLLKEIKGEKIIGIDIKRISPFPERITDADVIFDMMIHDLDLLHLLMPEEIIEIKAKGEKIRTKFFDRVVANITYKSGAIARIESSRVFGSITRNISITTEKYLIEADLFGKKIYLRDFSSPTPSTLPIKNVDQLTEEQKSFVAAVRGKRPATVSPDEIYQTLILAEEVKQAC